MPTRILFVVAMAMSACTARGSSQPTPIRDEGDPKPAPVAEPERTLDPAPATAPAIGLSQLAPGVHHACALESGQVLCWGNNRNDQLGVGPGLPEAVTTPTPVIGLDEVGPIVALQSDYDFSCAVTHAGAVLCWGANDRGQLGQSDALARDRPSRVGRIEASKLALGFGHACAFGRASAWCWGDDFGPGVVEVAALAKLDALVIPEAHTCTLERGQMRCWGPNSSGQVGNGEGGCEYDEPLCADCKRLPDQTCMKVDEPTAPLGLPKVTAIAASSSYTYALDLDGGVWQWGQVGQTMSFSPKPNYRPQRVEGLAPVVEISAGAGHLCARTEAGEVWCWGNDSFGQLGFEKPSNFESEFPVPRRVDGLPPASSIAVGFYFSCALTGTGVDTQAWCWGDNGDGQLGDGTRDRRPTPSLVHARAGRLAEVRRAG